MGEIIGTLRKNYSIHIKKVVAARRITALYGLPVHMDISFSAKSPEKTIPSPHRSVEQAPHPHQHSWHHAHIGGVGTPPYDG